MEMDCGEWVQVGASSAAFAFNEACGPSYPVNVNRPDSASSCVGRPAFHGGPARQETHVPKQPRSPKDASANATPREGHGTPWLAGAGVEVYLNPHHSLTAARGDERHVFHPKPDAADLPAMECPTCKGLGTGRDGTGNCPSCMGEGEVDGETHMDLIAEE